MPDKPKRSSRRFSQRQQRFLLMVLVLGGLCWLKREGLHNSLYQFLNPLYGEILFHSDLDGDGVLQLYHLTFNTGLNYRHIEQLTNLPFGAQNGAYSPDGTQIVFQSNRSIWVMAANGEHQREIAREYDNFTPWSLKADSAFRPQWLSDTHLLYQRVVGYYLTDALTACSVTMPFLFDLSLGVEIPLFKVQPEFTTQHGNWLQFSLYTRGMACRESVKWQVVDTPLLTIPAYQAFMQNGFASETTALLTQQAILSPSSQELARTTVSPYRDQYSGIELYRDAAWQPLLRVHSDVVSWSPDEQYLVYDARHPSGTWVLALISLEGTFTYPLLGEDGQDYFAPSWKP